MPRPSQSSSAPGPPPDPPDDPIAAYRARSRYAPTSGRLHPEAVDLLEPNRRYERPRAIEATLDRGPAAVVTFQLEADRFHYEGDETVTAALHVRRGDERLPVRIVRARALATGLPEEEAEDAAVRLTFGLRDGVPKTDLDLAETFPDHHGTIDLLVDFEWEPGATERAELRIATQPADAAPAFFTGRNTDHADTGSVVVEVGIDVEQAGFYRLDANLFDSAGQPLAHGHFKGTLDAGVTRAPIEFFGLLLIDIGVSGPYEVRNLRGYLFREGRHPDKLRMRDAEGSHWTGPYEVSSLSDEEFTSPHKERMLELLAVDLEAGRTADIPEPAAPQPGE